MLGDAACVKRGKMVSYSHHASKRSAPKRARRRIAMIIFTDTSADLPEEYLAQHDVRCLPMQFIIDGREYTRYAQANMAGAGDFYDYLRGGGVVSTSMINQQTYYDAFKSVVAAGDDLLYIGLSSGLSASYENACKAAQALAEQYPDHRAYVVDNRIASMGVGLVVHYAVMHRDRGGSAEEFYLWHKEHAMCFNAWFTVDDLKFLARGGRLSSSSAFFGTVLNIKPVLNMDEEGHLIARDKVKGRKQALTGLVNHMMDLVDDWNQPIFLSHGDCEEDMLFVKNLIEEKTRGKVALTGYIGPVIGAHSGPGTVALFFFGRDRQYKLSSKAKLGKKEKE